MEAMEATDPCLESPRDLGEGDKEDVLGEPVEEYVARAFRPAVARYFRNRNALRIRFLAMFDVFSMVLVVWQSVIELSFCCPGCLGAQPHMVTIFNYCTIVVNAVICIVQVAIWIGQMYTLCTNRTLSEIKTTIMRINRCQRILVLIRGSVQLAVAAVVPQVYSMYLFHGLGSPPPECLAITLQISAVGAFLAMVSVVEYNYVARLDFVDRVLTRFRLKRIIDMDAIVDVLPALPKLFMHQCGFAK